MPLSTFDEWLAEHGIDEVECIVPDMSGTARGKSLPALKLAKGAETRGLRISEDIFTLTVSGRNSLKSDATDKASIDVYMRPDSDTIRVVPWYDNPTAQLSATASTSTTADIVPRFVLQKMVGLYHGSVWRPVVAPELKFYLVKKSFSGNREKRYRHAARHLSDCASLATSIENFRGVETHEEYVASATG